MRSPDAVLNAKAHQQAWNHTIGGHWTVDWDCYIEYINKAGETVEAEPGNPPRFITESTQLRVKYLPEKPKYVLMVKE